MKIKEQSYDNLAINYPIDKITEKERLLFLDIETTGFTAKTSSLYMIGCAYYREQSFHLIQWFAEYKEEESLILSAFLSFSKKFTYLVHFNGNNFDIPYLVEKCRQYGLIFHVECMDGLDLYRRVAPIKKFLKLENCKQKTIESFLQISREDTYSGGELIDVYHQYTKSPSPELYDLLAQHNADDIAGMLRILPILSYVDLLTDPLVVTKAQGNYYHDIHGKQRQEIILNMKLATPLPIRISFSRGGFYFTGEGYSASLRIPLYQEEMKYFYSNYKDYYYLPEEDTALHKSVASYVDTDHRQPATAATCYTKKYSLFLPEWSKLFTPIFKRDYHDNHAFFELTDSFKTDRNAFAKYANHVLSHLMMLND